MAYMQNLLSWTRTQIWGNNISNAWSLLVGTPMPVAIGYVKGLLGYYELRYSKRSITIITSRGRSATLTEIYGSYAKEVPLTFRATKASLVAVWAIIRSSLRVWNLKHLKPLCIRQYTEPEELLEGLPLKGRYIERQVRYYDLAWCHIRLWPTGLTLRTLSCAEVGLTKLRNATRE